MIILESKIYRPIRRLFLDVVLNALNLIDELKLKIEYWFRTKERTEEEWEIKNEIEEEEERFYLKVPKNRVEGGRIWKWMEERFVYWWLKLPKTYSLALLLPIYVTFDLFIKLLHWIGCTFVLNKEFHIIALNQFLMLRA